MSKRYYLALRGHASVTSSLRSCDASGYPLLVFTLERREGELACVLSGQHKVTEYGLDSVLSQPIPLLGRAHPDHVGVL